MRKTLAVAIGETADNLEYFIEPYLIKEGFLSRTPRGRIALPAAARHLGLAKKCAIAGRKMTESADNALAIRVYYEDTDAGGVVLLCQLRAFF